MLVGRLPLAQIPPGAYDIRVTVTAGTQSAARTAGVTIVK